MHIRRDDDPPLDDDNGGRSKVGQNNITHLSERCTVDGCHQTFRRRHGQSFRIMIIFVVFETNATGGYNYRLN